MKALVGGLLVFVLCFTCCVTTNTTVGNSSPGFYDKNCNADTFSPSFKSVSSVLAIINGSVVTAASGIYLMYVCFSRFLTTMTK
ncbi:hypothetical protein RHVP.53 [Cricetid gammaherpesvirus 2]|uniref:Herpesvirus envelope glycoprotein N domain-containing protein n=1 Tax=Cricetid gammaherpesvirus 2 TaxID=1605972 RepID=E9M5N6_9GAMA|nr:hypothetical protein RHVP.53 [Cricetid gammaherpesvirus 2]ADW24394.1 hypothetical protein RHVP.53 [Cricetid gammaherpesvirus 2]ADW24476.1 hypothetical protein RHVP-L.53 [Cricetid gammaherpesvirus 2]